MIPDGIRIEPGLFGRIGNALAPFARDGRIVVVSDDNVWAAQRPRLDFGGLEPVPVLVPPGEGSKSWEELIRLIDRLLELGIERSDHVVALGGGVVGDLAGFAAAVLKRGCGVVQVPTSLLAQVDSSVGGKTGIDVSAGKNLVGAFHPPAAVLIDPDCLDTLPERELRAGYAEVVKYGLIGDRDFFAWCEAHGAALLAGDRDARVRAIRTSVAAKAAIVAEDPLETKGRRALLNLGHTFGHAIEAETGYRMLHGEAVALGMALAFRLSAELDLCPSADAERVAAHLAGSGLPTRLGEAGISGGAALVGHMRHDKKASGGRVRFILARGIGEAFVADGVDLARVERFLDEQG